MKSKKIKKLKTGQSMTLLFTGFEIEIYGLKMIFTRLVVNEGKISLGPKKGKAPRKVIIPDTVVPLLHFHSPVSHFGPNGPSINQISFSISWEGVNIAGDGLVISTIDDFLIMTNQMYAAGKKAFKSLNLAELRKLSGDPNLPAVSQWGGVENDLLPVVSLAPNPLNNRQAAIDNALPKKFTALAWSTKDFKHFLAYKLEIKDDSISAVVEFSEWPDNPKGAPKLLTTYNVTDQLGATLPFMYFTYWINAYAVDPNTPLDHVLLSIPDSSNSTVMSGNIPNTQVIFNVHFKQTYQNNTLTPLFASFGILPVNKGTQVSKKVKAV
ncbi:MAG: hypothetical protein HEP71_02765 [Roseivirga sp.]|nr:hypothetical protein [Roseivirga sp.]